MARGSFFSCICCFYTESVKKLDSLVSKNFTLCVFGGKKFDVREWSGVTLHQQDGKSASWTLEQKE